MKTKFKILSSRLLVMILNFQLLLPTNAFSANGNAINNIANALSIGGGVVQQQFQQMQAQQLSMQKKNELRGILGIQVADPNQVPEVIAQSNCPVIGAVSNDLNMDMQCGNDFDPDLYFSGHYEAYQEIAEENYNSVKAILSKQHNRDSADGVTCYEKATNNFKSVLELRLENLKKRKEKLNQLVKNFQTKNQERVEQMRKADALLNGPKGNDKLMSDTIKDFKFDQAFGDTQCKSFFESATLTKTGQQGGLRSVESIVEKSRTEIKPEAFKADLAQMKKEIKMLATKLSQDTKSSKTLSYDKNVITASKLTTISPNSKAIEQTLNRIQATAQLEMKDLETRTAKMIGSDSALEAGNLMKGIKENTINDVEFKLKEMERKSKLSCIQSSVKSQFGSIQSFASQFEDPSVSKNANEEADRPFLNFLAKTLSRTDISINKMRQLITLRQSQGANSRLVTKLNKTNHFEIKGKATTIGASQLQRPADLVGVFADKCVEIYEDQGNEQGVTTKGLIDGLRNYNSQYKKVQSQFAANLGNELVDNLLNCPSDNKTGKATNSCSKDNMDSNSANFCVKTANSCASNIMACDAKVKNMINDTRTKQVSIAKKYKEEMDSLKLGLAREISLMAAATEQESRILDAKYKFGTTYKGPEDMSISLKDDEKIFDAIIQDASLQIEDPIAFQEKINERIDKVIAQTTKHNEDLKSGLDKEVAKYIANAEKEKTKWEGIAKACHSKIDKEYAAYRANIEKQNQEQQKAFADKRQKECKKYYDFKSDPCPGGKVNDVAGDVSMIAAAVGSSVTSQGIQQTINSCQLHSNQSNSTDGTEAGKLPKLSTIESVCNDEKNKNDPDTSILAACKKLKRNDEYYNPYSGFEDEQKVCTLEDIEKIEPITKYIEKHYGYKAESEKINRGSQFDPENRNQIYKAYLKTDYFDEDITKEDWHEKLNCITISGKANKEKEIESWEKEARKIQAVADLQNKATQASEVGQLDFAYCDNMNNSQVNEKAYGQQPGRDIASEVLNSFMVNGAQ